MISETYVTLIKYKEMTRKWIAKNGRLPAERVMPAKGLLQIILKAKEGGHFPINPIGSVKTHTESVLDEATKSLKGELTKMFTFCPEESTFK